MGLAVLALLAPYLFNALVLPHLSGDFTVAQGASDRTRAAFVFGIIDWALAAAAFVVSLVFYRKVRRPLATGVSSGGDEGATPRTAARGALVLLCAMGALAAIFTIRLGWALFWTMAVQHMGSA